MSISLNLLLNSLRIEERIDIIMYCHVSHLLLFLVVSFFFLLLNFMLSFERLQLTNGFGYFRDGY